ncbi:hypothetical protein EDB85DRAFT_1899436 [Lactarius pseudohatsudake]|nr:hypothetical protein EDB85DRAFT_1899436 [Lactarius pseudohatsudake]
MTTLPPFRLSITSAGLAVPATQPTSQAILGGRALPAQDSNSCAWGSFRYDQESGHYNLSWGSFAEFDTWRQEVERADSVEICLAKKEAKGLNYSWKHVYRCTRQGTSGIKLVLPKSGLELRCSRDVLNVFECPSPTAGSINQHYYPKEPGAQSALYCQEGNCDVDCDEMFSTQWTLGHSKGICAVVPVFRSFLRIRPPQPPVPHHILIIGAEQPSLALLTLFALNSPDMILEYGPRQHLYCLLRGLCQPHLCAPNKPRAFHHSMGSCALSCAPGHEEHRICGGYTGFRKGVCLHGRNPDLEQFHPNALVELRDGRRNAQESRRVLVCISMLLLVFTK